jgi:hypothetical protein
VCRHWLQVLSAVDRDIEWENKFLVRDSRIRFTRHATGKFELLKHYDFEISEKQVVETVLRPERLENRGNQSFATRTMDSRHA